MSWVAAGSAAVGVAGSMFGGGGGGILGGTSTGGAPKNLTVTFGHRYFGTGAGASGSNVESTDNNKGTAAPVAGSKYTLWIVAGLAALVAVIAFTLGRKKG